MPSRTSPFAPVATGLLPAQATPYTWSILGLMADRITRDCYARLGHMSFSRELLWRYQAGQVIENSGMLVAAQEALALENPQATSSVGQLLGRGQDRRSSAIISATLVDAPARFAAAERWYQRVSGMQWRQATVLQVMEEIEPQAEAVFCGCLDLSLAMSLLSTQLHQSFSELAPDLLQGLDQDSGTLDYRYALAGLGRQAAAEPDVLASLDAGRGMGRMESVTATSVRAALERFLETYGRWASEPLEAASPRWSETPESLVAVALATEAVPNPDLARQQRAASAAAASKQVGILRRRQLDSLVQQLAQVAGLAADGRRAMVTVIAGARAWALGAGQEATADGRLAAVPDVFLLELEELKQMATGEWHSADQVRSVVEERRGWGAG